MRERALPQNDQVVAPEEQVAVRDLVHMSSLVTQLVSELYGASAASQAEAAATESVSASSEAAEPMEQE